MATAKNSVVTSNESAVMRSAPAVEPSHMKLNESGAHYQNYFIRLPQGFIGDDLKEFTAWKKIQASTKPLVKHDRVYVVAHDESWAAEGIVADADTDGVTLTGLRIFTFPPSRRALYNDELHRVEWGGLGYRVIRKRDGLIVADGFHTEGQAIGALNAQYPRRVS